jgi:phosphatidylethanolamine/phosphatidyl-N-methylethanolamine N-methyltransferase
MQYGTIRESSPDLARLLLDQVPPNPEWIVEFGAGTGPITEELARRFPAERVFSFELDPDLAQKVRQRAHGVQILNENVIRAPQVLPAEVVGHVDAVVSSLPLLNLSEETTRKILVAAFRILKPQGVFIQYTYLPVLPPIRAHRELGLWAQYEGVVWKNFPPGHVWVFRK